MHKILTKKLIYSKLEVINYVYHIQNILGIVNLLSYFEETAKEESSNGFTALISYLI